MVEDIDKGMSEREGLVPHVVVIVGPEFSCNTFILITETLRIANQNTGRRMFDWIVAAETARPVRATNGMWLEVDRTLDKVSATDVAVVIGGNLTFQRITPRLLNALRRFARHGAIIGAANSGAFALAEAGLLDDYAFTVHWETMPIFREHFPNLEPVDRLWVRDRDRITTAGGTGAIDMMLDLIGMFHGVQLATEVANGLAHHQRDPDAPQRNMQPQVDAESSLVTRLLRLMETNVETPLSAEELAGRLNVERRTIERTCRRAFGESPMRLYLKVRLQTARNLLFYDELPIGEIALICGFSYPSVFTRAFRRCFGMGPQDFRTSFRAQQVRRIRPELSRMMLRSGASGMGRTGSGSDILSETANAQP